MLPTTNLNRPHTKWPIAIAFGVIGSLVVCLVVLAFLWPAKASTPQNLPISLAGPEAATSAFQAAIEEASPGAFDFVTADDRDDAESQVESRQTYGAIVLAAPPATPEVLTAPAASALATQLLTGVATQLQAQAAAQVTAAGGDPSTAQVTVTPIVPLSASDPTGAGLAAASFPMMLGGMIGGILISLLVVGVFRRLAALLGFAVATGLLLALILQNWFEFLQGDFWLNATGLGLAVLATSSFIVGLSALLGPAGIGLAAAITVLFANPLSAAATPWEFLPTPWGAIGQAFVPGASNWLIRTLSYFPDADASLRWWILIGWTALGVLLALVGRLRNKELMHVPAETLHEQETGVTTAGATQPA